jgi:hypothetical protein
MEFKEKFVAFIDVLGFKGMIEAAENGTGRPLSEIRDILTELGRSKDKDFYKNHGPQVCPHSNYVQKDLGFEITQVTDCAVISSEISPAGVINIVNHCWAAAITLLTKGVMVRGYITRGKIYHEGIDFYGTGYQNALKGEGGVTAFKKEVDEKGTPFIEVDPAISQYVSQNTDECVQKMFNRYVKRDGDVTALFPFQVLSHSFMIAGFGMPKFDPQKEKKSNDNLRNSLRKFKELVMQYVDPNHADAMRKARHYIAALDAQLEGCDKTDAMIDALCRPLGRRI